VRGVLAVFGREFRSFFVSPVAYIVIGFFLVLSGYFFYGSLVRFVEISIAYTQQARMYGMAPPPMNLNEWVVRPFFYNEGIIILFLMPIITMRLFSEEKKSRTIELLLTSPVTDLQVVLGKYLAGLALYAVMLALTLVYQIVLFAAGSPDVGPVLTGYLGLLLLGASFLSLGMLISSLTENQIVAATASFGLFLLLWVLAWTSQMAGGGLGEVLGYISITQHLHDFAKGVIDTKDVIYYLSFIFLGGFLTLRSLESMRWRG
jgi:ABC-2 type transport system permease protein